MSTTARALSPRSWIASGVALATGLALAAPAAAQTSSSPGGAGTSATSSSAQKSRLGSRTLRQGMRGRDVAEAQQLLGRLDFSIVADGEFGRGTLAAVKRFEKADRIQVDGVLVRSDQRRLRRAAVVSAAGATGGAEAEMPLAPLSPDDAGAPAPTTPGEQAKVGADGLAVAPDSAPQAVKDIIAAGNQIAKLPYRYGGGHNLSFKDTAYDCSGSVSFALKGAELVKSPMPSGSYTSWGDPGPGKWVTIYTHSGHIYMVVAGLRFDTSGRAQSGTRWQKASRSPAGFTVRHPRGL